MHPPRRLAPAFAALAFAIFATAASPVEADEPGVDVHARFDEPQVEEATTPRTHYFRRLDRGPRLKASYRWFAAANETGAAVGHDAAAIDHYFISNYARVAAGAELALIRDTPSELIASGTITLGVQYPARVTPFVDLIAGFGLFRRAVMPAGPFGFAYHVGVDAGGEYAVVAGYLLASVAIGWRRMVLRYPAADGDPPRDIARDSFTFKLGLAY